MSAPHQLLRATFAPGNRSANVHVVRGPGADVDAGALQHAKSAAAFRAFLESLGIDVSEPMLAGTAHRVARSYREILGGLEADAEPRLTSFPNTERHTGIVSVTGISFYSMCAHHFLPFFGIAHVGYVPGDRLVGLSKLGRVVDFYARRPQLQEQMTEQIAALLDERLAPRGVIVSLQARHMCMEMRGVSKPNVTTTTMALRGTLQDERLQNQFFARLRAGDKTAPTLEI
jgi:GTP cyclohydrolase IA